MVFFLTLLYLALTLLSPAVLPEAITALHVNVIVGGLLILALLPKIGKSQLGRLPDLYLLLGLLSVSAIGLMLTGWLGGVVNSIALVPLISAFPFIFISCDSLERLKILSSTLAVVAIFIFCRGLAAVLSGDFTSPYVLAEGVSGNLVYRFRGLGILGDPNDVAQFYLLVLPLLWLRWKKGSGTQNLLFTLIPACVLLYAVYCTHSRGAVFAELAMIWFAFKDRIGVIASTMLAGVALMAAIVLNVSGGRALNDDNGGRVAAWATGLEVFRSHPFFGVGLGNFSNFNDTGMTAHNSYVLCLSELGICGYFCWMGMIMTGWSGLAQGRNGGAPRKLAVENSSGASVEVEERLDARRGQDIPGIERASPSADAIEWAGRVIQISMVGVLVTSFFISRTYSLVLYTVLGMAAAHRIVCIRLNPDIGFNSAFSPRKVFGIIALSIGFVYLVVRVGK
jgi:putative inorganic carbon (hco3(-)) transporter